MKRPFLLIGQPNITSCRHQCSSSVLHNRIIVLCCCRYVDFWKETVNSVSIRHFQHLIKPLFFKEWWHFISRIFCVCVASCVELFGFSVSNYFKWKVTKVCSSRWIVNTVWLVSFSINETYKLHSPVLTLFVFFSLISVFCFLYRCVFKTES